MKEIESYVERAIREVSRSVLDEQEKRNIIYTLYRLEELGDCGFTNLRTLSEQVRCKYTFLFSREQMYDYTARRRFYDDELPKLNAFANGDIYFTGVLLNPPDMVCVDSGSQAWEAMVELGAIRDLGAQPVEELDPKYVLKRLRVMFGSLDPAMQTAHLALFILSGAIGGLLDKEYPLQFGKTREQIERMLKSGKAD